MASIPDFAGNFSRSRVLAPARSVIACGKGFVVTESGSNSS